MPISIEIPACETTVPVLPQRTRPSSGLRHTCATSRASHGSPLRTAPISPRCVFVAERSCRLGHAVVDTRSDSGRKCSRVLLTWKPAGQTKVRTVIQLRSDDFISLIAEEPLCARDWIAVSDLRGTDPSIVSSNIGKCRTGTWKARSGTAASLVLGQSCHRSR